MLDKRQIEKTAELRLSLQKAMARLLEFGDRSRFVVLFIGLMTLSTTLACVICFNVAVIRMTNIETSPLYRPNSTTDDEVDYANTSLPMADRRFRFTTTQRSLLFSSTFFSPVTLFWIVAWSMRRYGTLKTQLVCGISTTIFTAITPFIVAYLPFWALFLSRFLQGIPLCNLYPVVGSIVNQWAATNERGLFISVLTGYLQLSCIIAMPLSGILSELVGWPIAFYVHAAVNAFFFFLWAIFYRNDPNEHPFISRRELMKIVDGRLERSNPPPTNVPYLQIFRTKSVIAVYVAVLGNFVTFNFANTFFPSYLASLFSIPTLPAGIIPAIVLSGNFAVKFVTGIICDRLTHISELSKVCWCNSIAFCGAAVGLVVYLAIPSSWPVLSIIFLAFPFVILGVNAGGFPKSAVLISGQHGPTILAALQVFLCGSFLLGSFVVPAMTPNRTYEEFTNVFRLYVVVLIITNGIFVAWSKASPEPWAQPTNLSPSPTEEKRALSS